MISRSRKEFIDYDVLSQRVEKQLKALKINESTRVYLNGYCTGLVAWAVTECNREFIKTKKEKRGRCDSNAELVVSAL